MPFKYTNPDTNETIELTYDPSANQDQPPAQTKELTPELGTDTTGWDITRGTKRTLAQYLSNLTRGKMGGTRGNEYNVGNGLVEIDTTRPDGYPTSPSVQWNGRREPSEGYIRDVRNVPELGYSSTSDDYANAQRDSFKLRKGVFGAGGPQSGEQNGNSLLRSIDVKVNDDGTAKVVRPGDNQVVKQYVSNVLLKNRFTNDNAAPETDVPVKMGGDAGVNNLKDETHVYSQKRLANVGPLLSLRASGEPGSMNDGANPAGSSLEAKALLPGKNQLGLTRIDAASLDVKKIVETLTTSEDVKEINPNDKSWGVLNNVHDQYFGVSAVGMQVTSLALLLSMVSLFELFGVILSFMSKPEFKRRDSSGRYLLGVYSVNTKQGDPNGFPLPSIGPELLGLANTVNDYRSCVEAGLKAFYGIDDVNVVSLTAKVATQAIGLATGSGDHPGQQIAVARTIMRSGTIIYDAFANIGGNPISIIKGFLSAMDTIRKSRFIVALNLFAKLGDQILESEKLSVVDNATEHAPARTSKMDNNDPEMTQAVAMNRVRGSSQIAWASMRSPFQMLLPSAVVIPSSLAVNLGATRGPGIASKYAGEVPSSANKMQVGLIDTGRISTDSRVKFEQQLDAEYVPFYFHDLRTNEIVSFHAFLASLSDVYSPAYESVEGIGRIDPVKIYKSTQRKLDLSFFIVSTSTRDFDVMWLKINKLVTLVYPQFTRGRMIFDGDSLDSSKNVIVQPFSQVIGASPLIRLRVGDIVRSNYSKFNLARLFGFGMDEMKIDGESMSGPNTEDTQRLHADVQKKLKQFYQDGVQPPTDFKFTLHNGARVVSRDNNTFVNEWVVGSSNDFPDYDILSCTVKKVVDVFAYIEIGIESVDKLSPASAMLANWITTHQEKNKVVGGTYVVPIADLTMTNGSYTNLTRVVQDSQLSKLQNFMSEETNVLVKSFKNTGGKGLAGVIESMSFNWIENTPWETAPGRTAPMICKVSMNFSVIHDISPGLDWQGYNRAPVYPVGAAHSFTTEVPNGR